MSNIDEELEVENYQPQAPVNKGPFIGLIVAVIGLLLLISSFFMGSSVTSTINGEISYASKQKISGEVRYQEVKVKYEYQGSNYETALKIQNGKYSKYDAVSVKIIDGNPTNISITSVNSGRGPIIFCGILFLAIGILLFLNIIPYQKLEAKGMGMMRGFVKPNIESGAEKEHKPNPMFDAVSDFLDKLPKKDRDNTKDDMEERISKRKQANSKQKEKNNQVYMSDNILDLYDDDEDEEDDDE